MHTRRGISEALRQRGSAHELASPLFWLVSRPVGFRERPGSPLLFTRTRASAPYKQMQVHRMGSSVSFRYCGEKPKGIAPRLASALSGLRLARDDRVIIVFYFFTSAVLQDESRFQDPRSQSERSGLSDPGSGVKAGLTAEFTGDSSLRRWSAIVSSRADRKPLRLFEGSPQTKNGDRLLCSPSISSMAGLKGKYLTLSKFLL